MKRKFILLLAVLAIFVFSVVNTGCTTDDNQQNNFEMTDLDIDDDFDFTFTRDVTVSLRALYKGTFYIYDTSDNLISKGLIDVPDGFYGTIQIPKSVSIVKLRFSEINDIMVTYDIFGDNIDYFFAEIESDRDERTDPQVYSIFNCLEHLGGGYYNIYFNYYSEYDQPVTINTGYCNRFKFAEGDDRDDDYYIIDDVGQPEVFDPGYHVNAFVLENHYFECEEDDRDDDECWIKWELRCDYGASTSASYAYNDDDYLCPRGMDFDGDGVMDVDDDFPDDPDRAYLNYYPGTNDQTWGTLAFEDKWPLMGDYDFNDLVINYRYETVDSPDDELFEIYGYFSLRASGASYQNGFALELPFYPANFETLTLSPDDYTGFALIPGSESQILRFFSDALEVMNKPPENNFVNTDVEETYSDPVDFELYIKLYDPVDEASLAFGLPYNPFVLLNNNPTMEVHLPDMPPTFNANTEFFNNEDDDSNPASGRYYKTAINLPWAINIPSQWSYPIERISIIQAYNFFDEWAESSGTERTDWYENSGNNTVEENLFPNP